MSRRRQPGEPASLYVDLYEYVEDGDYIRTPSGRQYLVQSVRIQKTGKHVGRQHLKTVVMEPDHQPGDDAVIHDMSSGIRDHHGPERERVMIDSLSFGHRPL